MNPRDYIIAKQIAWAEENGLRLTGSAGDRGRKVYTSTLKSNLFNPLNARTRRDLENGDGGELVGKKGNPAKIQALHSSSALGINVFDYWRGSPDLSPIVSSCGLPRGGKTEVGDVRFEQKFPIENCFRFSPNLDVVIALENSRYKAIAIECKFTEAYSSRHHGGVDSKYFENDDIWSDLSSTRELAQSISQDDDLFHFLHAAQLVKHILGLNREFGHSSYRLLYLWYDALGEPGFLHRQETERFAAIVRSDGVDFHESTYQDLIVRLARYRKDNEDYVTYITQRYL